MGFRKTVIAETENLAEQPLGEFPLVTALEHAPDEFLAIRLESALALPGGHVAAQLVGLATTEAGRHHGQFHDLFLEDRHAQRAFEHLLRFLAGIDDFLLAVAPVEIGMDHVSLDGSGAHDGDLDHQVVVIARTQPRQHAHLGAGFDLEHADGVGPAHHVVDPRVFRGNAVHAQRPTAVGADQFQALANRGEHAQGQHIDLQQAEGFEIVLFPLDHRAVRHRGVLDRHEPGERTPADDETAHVLRQVSGKTLQGPGQAQQHAHPGGGVVYLGVLQLLFQVLAPPVDRLGEMIDQPGLQPQRLAHVAHRAPGPITDYRRRQRGPVAAIALINVLDDFLAPGMFEIDVDVRRLVALPGDEALEQQFDPRRIDFGDSQAIAHRRIGRRAAALAENSAATGKIHHVMDGEKIMLVTQLPNQRQFLLQQQAHPGRRAFGPAPPHSPDRQPA